MPKRLKRRWSPHCIFGVLAFVLHPGLKPLKRFGTGSVDSLRDVISRSVPSNPDGTSQSRILLQQAHHAFVQENTSAAFNLSPVRNTQLVKALCMDSSNLQLERILTLKMTKHVWKAHVQLIAKLAWVRLHQIYGIVLAHGTS